VLPVKFLGGTLAIGAGLALGREGPSVQMGASIGTTTARLFRRPAGESRALLAACAGAGLATAFNAPIAGAVFVLEELVQRFEHRTAIAALAASAAAIAVARLLLGDAPDFALPPIPAPEAAAHPLFFALGAAMGLLAVGYNASLLATLALFERVPVLLRAALVGGAVAAIGFAMPALVGGGDALTERSLAGVEDLALLPLLFLVRLALGAASYAAATPGGLFAPLLVLGAQAGLMVGALCRDALPGLAIEPAGFALVGMAAFFTGVVRAPITGIILVTEMTANVALLQPMLGACFLAMLVPTLLRSAPIYESLRLRVKR
jgi:CIC family chloride channel protein